DETTAALAPAAQNVSASAFAPLRHRLFRWLWIASLASNIGTWMQTVGAAWLMTDLSTSSLMIGLVQTAVHLPVFLLAIPAGAVVAASSPAAAFLLNAVSFVGVIVVLARWRRPHEVSVLPAERLMAAMRVGVRHVRNSPALQAVCLRAATVIIGASGLWVLL